MTLTDALMLVGVGLIAGFINTLAGGGSLLTLPILIFLGLPSAEANASNRVALFVQNIFAIRGFKSKGVSVFPYSYWVGLSACGGAIIGSLIAVDIRDELFNKILAVVMVMVILASIFKPLLMPKHEAENPFTKRKNVISIILFFFIGIYGGFIQAGVGFLVIAALSAVHSLKMAMTNSIKVFVIFSYTIVAIIIFLVNDLIRWEYGLVLAIGNSAGAWFTSRWSVNVPDKYVRGFLIVAVTALAIKLWFF